MPRFRDQWVVDKVLFDYVSGGSCACCGFSHMFLPNGTDDLIDGCTDLDTDQAQNEKQNLPFHPWPAELRDQVWADRVKLRQRLKRSMKDYARFWKDRGSDFTVWCRNNGRILSRLLQLPRSEILNTLQNSYNIHSAYAVVLCAVVEQVAHFDLTKYSADAPPARIDDDTSETNFETCLKFSRMSGFTMHVVEHDAVNEEILDVWLKRMASLGGPKLLGRGSSNRTTDTTEDDNEEGGDADDAVVEGGAASGPSFQSDRRIVRLLIARYWADALMKRYLDDTKNTQQTVEMEVEAEEKIDLID